LAKEIQILTVSELTKEIRSTLEETFDQVSVIGEISNFKSQTIIKHQITNPKLQISNNTGRANFKSQRTAKKQITNGPNKCSLSGHFEH